MATNFPGGLDTYSDVVTGTPIIVSTTNNVQDAIEAIEAKLGTGDLIAVSKGGTGSSTAGDARTALGLGTSADVTFSAITATSTLAVTGITTLASRIEIIDTYTAKYSDNQIIFNRAGASYVDQISDSGSLVFRQGSSNTTALTINSSADVYVASYLNVAGQIYAETASIVANTSGYGINVTQAGAGSALKLTSNTSSSANSVFRIVNNSEDMASKAQYNEIYPTLTVGASKGWTNTHISSKTTGYGTNKNTSYMRGLLLESYGGGSPTGGEDDNGQDLSELVSIYNAYGVYSGAGTVDSIYGLLLEPYSKTGSIGNMYDLYLKTRVGGGTITGTHWGIYQQDTTVPNYFGSTVRIGSTADQGANYKLSVSGGLKVTNNTSTDAIEIYQSGAGRGLMISSHASTNVNAVFRINNESVNMCSKAQLNTIKPTLTGAATEYWTNTHLQSVTKGTGTHKNSGWMRGLSVDSFAGGDASSDGQDLTDLTSIITAYGTYSGVGTIDNATGLYINPYKNSGTIGTMYDIYLGDGTLSSGSGTLTGTHWGVYQKRTDTPNNFAGGIKLGGVSNATLDDYEEGEWTPAIEQSSVAFDGGYTYQFADYVKIGSLVQATCWIRVAGTSGGSGTVSITGLPFPKNEHDYQQVGVLGYNKPLDTNCTRAWVNGSKMTIIDAAGTPISSTWANYSGAVGTGDLCLTVTYTTDS